MATSTKSKQMTAGKAFEYALLLEFENRLKQKTNVNVVKDSSFTVAKDCFHQVTSTEQGEYRLHASFAVNFLIDLEPRLENDISGDDILELAIVSDGAGKAGDVRDVLAIRKLQSWEIGVSAKNNHKAVKHSRLSPTIDFGKEWIGAKSSSTYFDEIKPIFDKLAKIRKDSGATKKWSEIGNYHKSVYVPVLNAFTKELKQLTSSNPGVAAKLITYLIGRQDFYKVIKRKKSLEIQAYNFQETLSLPFNNIKPKLVVPKTPLPTKIVDIQFKKGSQNTVMVGFDNDWILSFRIHNASSRVEPSLKFDIQIVNAPRNLFTNTLNIDSGGKP